MFLGSDNVIGLHNPGSASDIPAGLRGAVQPPCDLQDHFGALFSFLADSDGPNLSIPAPCFGQTGLASGAWAKEPVRRRVVQRRLGTALGAGFWTEGTDHCNPRLRQPKPIRTTPLRDRAKMWSMAARPDHAKARLDRDAFNPEAAPPINTAPDISVVSAVAEIESTLRAAANDDIRVPHDIHSTSDRVRVRPVFLGAVGEARLRWLRIRAVQRGRRREPGIIMAIPPRL